jgi:hypothetical protein
MIGSSTNANARGTSVEVAGRCSGSVRSKTTEKSMQKYISATFALAALATKLATPASAQTQITFSSTPISVQGFTAASQPAPVGREWVDGVPSGFTASNVTIAFVNTANVPATSVTFVVQSGNQTRTIVDKGTFSAGTRIVHTFDESPEFADATSVRVQSVTFADGNTWGI